MISKSFFANLLFFFGMHLAVNGQLSLSQGSVCLNAQVSVSLQTGSLSVTSVSWSSVPSQALFAPPAGTNPVISFSSCGQHTVSANVFNGLNLVGSYSQTVYVDCGTLSITPPTSTICPGYSQTLVATGASNPNWSHGAQGNSVVVSPGASTLFQVFSGACLATATLSVFDPTVTTSSWWLCPGSSATLSASGGTSHSWFNSAGGLISAGSPSLPVAPAALPATYSYVSTWNASCVAVKTLTLLLYNYIPSAAGPASVCPGGTAFFQASGASNYSWTAGTTLSLGPVFSHTQQAVTVYTLAADSAGCTGSRGFTVGLFTPPVLQVSASELTVCPGQTATLTASAALNYTWTLHPSLQSSQYSSSVVVAPSMVTVYTVTGSDANGCSAKAQKTIELGYYPSLSLLMSKDSVCPGYFSTLTATGAQTYTWVSFQLTTPVSGSLLIAGAGTYTLKGSNGGSCTDSVAVTVHAASPLALLVSQSSPGTCRRANGEIDPVQFFASGGVTYTWAPFLPGQMTYSIGSSTAVMPTVTTCYTVTASNGFCSGSETLCVVWGNCVGMEETVPETFASYPNPVEHDLFIRHNAPLAGISILDLSGKTMISSGSGQGQGTFSIDCSALPPGIYLVALEFPFRQKRFLLRKE